MTEPKVTEEVSYSTVTTTKNATTTNKRSIISRTTNVNAVQVNCYDADGTLKSKATDQDSWEERDTHNYEWSGGKKPLEVEAVLDEEEAKRSVFIGDQLAIEPDGDGTNVIILTSSDVCNAPAIQWTGTVEESEAKPDSEHNMSTKLEGSKWVRSKESVCMTMGKSGLPDSFNVKVSDFNGAVMNGKMPLNENGELVIVSQSTEKSSVVPLVSVVEPTLSSTERRQMRRNVNREMMSGKSQLVEK